MDIIWILPILCLSGSILYCSVRLWLMYREEIHIRAHRVLKRIGLWKTGMGRWNRLRQYNLCYICSAIISVVISIAIPKLTEKVVIEEITAFVERLSIVEIGKFFATVGFAVITVLESLLIGKCDLSKIYPRVPRLQKYLENSIFDIIAKGVFYIGPIVLWVLFGYFVYKDYFFRAIHEWISSPGRVFQLCWGAVSAIILGTAVFNNFLKKPKDLK